ncbi:hypothetical protein V1279_003104 [Bradyrhizobium sp. AZCC 1610]|uniref:hypothetical protein n=1 Tax=Bradyrhizobium sp. AZCC 1610 TaxID=3117020 RepID=UPI002FF06E50
MKIEGHLLEASDMGDKLRITGQGKAISDADWRPMLSMVIEVPMTDRNRKAFYVGRHFTMDLKPE